MVQNKIAIARAGVWCGFIDIGYGEIIQCCAFSRKWRVDFIAVAAGSVYDCCEIEKAMEFA
jgi:hypothetical protein